MPEQTYANHAHRPTLWMVAWLGAVIAFLLFGWEFVRGPSLFSLGLVVLSLTLFITVTILRIFVLRLQDRIIRLEMHGRLARLGLADGAARLSLRQMIALRFASDEELPFLASRAVADSMAPDDIKKAIRQWQADELRT